MNYFQKCIRTWVIKCFGLSVSDLLEERCFRFLEESLELVQALDLSEEQAIAVVRYTYGRPKGHVHQEIGGVMVTLAALCSSRMVNLDIEECAFMEYNRINVEDVIEKIRLKQASKRAVSGMQITGV